MNIKRPGLRRTLPGGLRAVVALGVLAGLPLSARALESLDDESLSQVDAQDGIVMQLNFGPAATEPVGIGVSLDRLYWEDKAGVVRGTATTGSTTTLRGYADTVTLKGKGMGATLALDFGSYNNHPGFNFDVTANIGTASGRSFRICDDTAGATPWTNGCGISLGALTIQTSDTSPLHFNLKTSDGLFNQTSAMQLLADIRNVNVYFNQAINFGDTQLSTNNQSILRNFNFNFLGTGYAYMTNVGGFIFQTDCPVASCDSLGMTPGVKFNRVTDPQYATKSLPGLNLELMYKSDSGDPTDVANFSLENAQGLIHLGASGDMTSAAMTLRGTDATGTTGVGSILGMAVAANGTATTTPVLGAGGLAATLKASFTNSGANPVTLELGHAGTNAFGVQFGNLSPLQIRTGCQSTGGASCLPNSGAATFTSGNVYVNMTASKKLLMPENTTLNAIPMGGSFLTTTPEYTFDAHPGTTSNPNMLVLAVRGMEFNSISRNSRFIVSNDVTNTAIARNSSDLTGFYDTGTGTWSGGSSWGLGLPFYNVNIDAALYGATGGVNTTEQRIGMGFALSTTGRNGVYDSATPANSTDTTKTTSILLIDGAPNANDTSCPGGCPTNFYVGVRNIDMYMAGMGSIGLNGDSTITTTQGMNLKIDKFTLALAGEVAAGYLPGSKVKTLGINQYAPSNSFTLKDDVLFGIRLKMAGDANLVITPGVSSGGLEDAALKAKNYPRLLGNLNLSSGALQLVEPVDGTILGFDNICGGSAGGAAVATYYGNSCGAGNLASAGVSLDNYIRINRDSVDFGYTLKFNPGNADANVFRIKDVEMFAACTGTGGGCSNGLLGRQRLGEMVLTGGTLATQLTLKPR